MRLYERLGVSLKDDVALEARLNVLNVSLEGGKDIELVKSSQINDREQVVLAYYLLEDQAELRRHADALADAVEDYLFGAWRHGYTTTRAVLDRSRPTGTRTVTVTLDDAQCRREFLWMGPFRAGILWALCLGREAAVSKLARYPGEDAFDEAPAALDLGPADKAYFILLSDLLLGRDAPGTSTNPVEKRGKKKHKLLLAALRVLRQRNDQEFSRILAECVRHHVKTELPHRGLQNKLAVDASILFHAARRARVSPSLPDALMDHVVHIDT